MAILISESGIPIVPLPAAHSEGYSLKKVSISLLMFLLKHTVFPVFMPLIILRAAKRTSLQNVCSSLRELDRVVSTASRNPASSFSEYQDNYLLATIWKQASALPYITQNALEYQDREGYCGRSTLRNILKSFKDFPPSIVPEPTSRPCSPEIWTKIIHNIAEEHGEKGIVPLMDTKVVRGDVSFEQFLETIREGLHDPSCRVAVNYLRTALTGFKSPKWIPVHYAISLMGGHFSPIIGLIEDDDHTKSSNGSGTKDSECMIAIFDVNHSYGGAYLVPAKMLYEAVKATDLTTNKSRALVVVRIGEDKTQ